MTWTDALGYTASAAVLATFCMNTMCALRILALISNVLFVLYGYFDGLYPVLVLHAILLPMNLLRLMQIRRSMGERPGAHQERHGHHKSASPNPSSSYSEAGRIWAQAKSSPDDTKHIYH
jgi:hypothetical protein